MIQRPITTGVYFTTVNPFSLFSFTECQLTHFWQMKSVRSVIPLVNWVYLFFFHVFAFVGRTLPRHTSPGVFEWCGKTKNQSVAKPQNLWDSGCVTGPEPSAGPVHGHGRQSHLLHTASVTGRTREQRRVLPPASPEAPVRKDPLNNRVASHSSWVAFSVTIIPRASELNISRHDDLPCHFQRSVTSTCKVSGVAHLSYIFHNTPGGLSG